MNGQEIDVPYHFICPISLQLMRDPVTVSTGITYDRHSIEAWLFSCRKRSCPATNQPLAGDDSTFLLTPNLTLRRLIHSWCTLNNSSALLDHRVPAPPPPLNPAELLRRARAAVDPADAIDSMSAIRSAAAEGGRKGLQAAGAIEVLAALLSNRERSFEEAAEISVEALSQLAGDEAGAKRLASAAGIMESLAAVMGRRGGSRQARTQAAALLLTAVKAAEAEQLSAMSAGVFSGVARAIEEGVSPRATKAGVKVVMKACRWGRNRAKAAEAGAGHALVELLASEWGWGRVGELAVGALELLCGCAEGRAAVAGHAAAVAVLANKMLRASPAATERAVRALALLCEKGAAPWVAREMLHVGAVAKLCTLLNSPDACTPKANAAALRILALHSSLWKSSPCFPPHLLSSYPS